jgi:hypothetical protein
MKTLNLNPCIINIHYVPPLIYNLPPSWHSMPNWWHINATLQHLILPLIEIGGKIFAGLRARCPLRHDKCRKGL